MADELEMAVRIVTILILIAVTVQKIVVMQRETKRWNGLGRALRFEKAMYLVFWIWLLFRPGWELLESVWSLVAIAVLLIIGEIRVFRHLPAFVVRLKAVGDAHEANGGTP